MPKPTPRLALERLENADDKYRSFLEAVIDLYLKEVRRLARNGGRHTVLTAAIDQPDDARPLKSDWRIMLETLRGIEVLEALLDEGKNDVLFDYEELVDEFIERGSENPGFDITDYGLDEDQPFDITALDWDLPPSFAVEWLEQNTNRLTGEFEDAVWSLVRSEIVDGLEAGEGIDRIVARLNRAGIDGLPEYLEGIVRETVTDAYNAGQTLTAVQFELGNPTWLATLDSRTRPAHMAMNERTRDVNGVYVFPGGQEMRWPGDSGLNAGAALTRNCRCTQVWEDDDDNPQDNNPVDAVVTEDQVNQFVANQGLTASGETPMASTLPIYRRFEGVAGFAGIATDDGSERMKGDITLTSRDLPLPLWTIFNNTHSGDSTPGPLTGEILEMAIRQNAQGEYRADISGVFFDTEEGRLAAAVGTGALRGLSMDPGGVFYQTDADGELVVNEDGMYQVSEYRIGGVTQVGIPAFEDAQFTSITEDDGFLAASAGDCENPEPKKIPAQPKIVDDSVADDWEIPVTHPEALTASAAPSTAFTLPEPPTPMPVTVFDDNTWAGHLATWGTCHTGFKDKCVTAPTSATGYGYFHQSTVDTDDGPVRVGKFTTRTGHAAGRLAARQAAAHYDNTGHCAAYGRVIDGAVGVWACGVINPNATDEMVAEFAASPQSGDWRSIGGNLELVASLAVNTPGFPIPEPAMWIEQGQQVGLTAAGIVTEFDADVLHGWIDEHGLLVAGGQLTAHTPSVDPELARSAADRAARSIGRPTAAEQKQALVAAAVERVHGAS